MRELKSLMFLVPQSMETQRKPCSEGNSRLKSDFRLSELLSAHSSKAGRAQGVFGQHFQRCTGWDCWGGNWEFTVSHPFRMGPGDAVL